MALAYEKVITVISKAPESRDEQDVVLISSWFRKKNDIFRDLSDAVLYDLVRHCRFQRFLENDVIIKQGDKGDSFYTILSGCVGIYVAHDEDVEGSSQPDEESPRAGDKSAMNLGSYIRSLGQGKSFGEVALIDSRNLRGASVIAEEDSDMIVIDRKLYTRSLKAGQKRELEGRITFVERHPLFGKWKPKHKHNLALGLSRRSFRYGNHISFQGEPIRKVHFILSGQALVTVERPALCKISQGRSSSALERSHPPAEVCLIGQSAVVGDIEAVCGLSHYVHTITCVEPVHTYEIDLRSFNKLVMRRHVQTMEKMRAFVVIKMQHRAERLRGMNVPLYQNILEKVLDHTVKQRNNGVMFPSARKHVPLAPKSPKRIQTGRWVQNSKVPDTAKSKELSPSRNISKGRSDIMGNRNQVPIVKAKVHQDSEAIRTAKSHKVTTSLSSVSEMFPEDGHSVLSNKLREPRPKHISGGINSSTEIQRHAANEQTQGTHVCQLQITAGGQMQITNREKQNIQWNLPSEEQEGHSHPSETKTATRGRPVITSNRSTQSQHSFEAACVSESDVFPSSDVSKPKEVQRTKDDINMYHIDQLLPDNSTSVVFVTERTPSGKEQRLFAGQIGHRSKESTDIVNTQQGIHDTNNSAKLDDSAEDTADNDRMQNNSSEASYAPRQATGSNNSCDHSEKSLRETKPLGPANALKLADSHAQNCSEDEDTTGTPFDDKVLGESEADNCLNTTQNYASGDNSDDKGGERQILDTSSAIHVSNTSQSQSLMPLNPEELRGLTYERFIIVSNEIKKFLIKVITDTRSFESGGFAGVQLRQRQINPTLPRFLNLAPESRRQLLSAPAGLGTHHGRGLDAPSWNSYANRKDVTKLPSLMPVRHCAGSNDQKPGNLQSRDSLDLVYRRFGDMKKTIPSRQYTKEEYKKLKEMLRIEQKRFIRYQMVL